MEKESPSQQGSETDQDGLEAGKANTTSRHSQICFKKNVIRRMLWMRTKRNACSAHSFSLSSHMPILSYLHLFGTIMRQFVAS